jgi:Peptidase family M1 domain
LQTKTLRFTADHMHDFAWFADKEFNVMQGSVILPESGRVVTTRVMCTQHQSRLWLKSLEYCNHAILEFSKGIGDYPYSSFTVVQSALSAGLGMEYPGITVIGTTKNAYTLDEVITHEIGHSWFYAALASNERRYPFMDESITNEYEERYMAIKYPDKKQWNRILEKEKHAKFLHADKIGAKQIQELSWLIPARNNTEQALNLSATDYSLTNYDQMIYNKGSMDFRYLRIFLGDSLYDASMKDYYKKWKFKHPQPEDLRSVLETHTNKKLNWFFEDLLGTTKRLDYKIVRIHYQQVLVKNNGELVSPLVIGGLIGDSVCFEKWCDGFNGEKWIDFPPGNYTEIKIDPNHITPELYRMNNNIRTSGIFPTADPIVPQFLFGLENPEKHSLMYLPAINWNYENGFMIGGALYNGIFIPKPIEYVFTSFYSANNSSLAGYGKVSFNITPYNNFIRLAKVSVDGTRFGSPGNKNFQKLTTRVDIYFRPQKMIDPIRKSMYGRIIFASDLSIPSQRGGESRPL